MTEPPTVTGARRKLGDQLRALRKAADMTQDTLAELTGWTRSTVANVETGRQKIGLDFFERCDEVLGSGGTLARGWKEIDGLVQQLHRDQADQARREREARIQGWRGGSGEASAPGLDGDTSDVAQRNEATKVIEKAFQQAVHGDESENDRRGEELQQRVLSAYQRSREAGEPLSLTLVGGFAGSGKSEFARFLSAITGWTILDKDTLTRALAEQLLIARGGDANDRQSSLYLEHVRPYEYRCMLDSGIENLKAGVSTVLTAPFLKEFSDPNWLRRFQNRCKTFNAVFSVIWVRVDLDSMYDYISYRGAARDAWKLANWDDYIASIDPGYRPDFPHYLVDNSLNAAVALADQARDIASRMKP